MINSGNVKLAAIKDDEYIDTLLAAIILGISGGIIGSLFIRINNRINVYRKKILGASKPRKVIEACILVVLTVCAFYASAFFRDLDIVCRPNNDQSDPLVSTGF